MAEKHHNRENKKVVNSPRNEKKQCLKEDANVLASTSIDTNSQLMLLSLPKEILYHILLFCDYDSISRLREVCKEFDDVAGSYLTKGFIKAQIEHAKCLKKVKDAIPRRESERRKHRLYSKHDALQGLDTRLSLLKMTYNKYIASGQCCFIPGKVLDELFSVLHKVKVNPEILSVTSLLQEVRDISSMAMEHFDEVLVPKLDTEHPTFSSLPFSFSSASLSFNESTSSFCDPNRSTSSLKSCNKCDVVKKQQKKMQNKVRSLSVQMKRCQKSATIHKKMLTIQNFKLQRMKLLTRTLNKTVQDLSSQTSEMSSQMQALRNAVTSGGISAHPIIDSMEETHCVPLHQTRSKGLHKISTKRSVCLGDENESNAASAAKRRR